MIDIALRQLLITDSIMRDYLNDEIYVQYRDSDDNTDFLTITSVNEKQPVNIQRETGQHEAQIQLDIYSSDGEKLRHIAAYLKNRFNGTAIETDAIDSQVSLLRATRMDFNSDDMQYHCSLDFTFFYHIK